MPMLQAQPWIDISTLKAGQDLSKLVEYVKDTNHNITIGQIDELNWLPATQGTNFGYTDATYWFRIQLENKTDDAKSILLDINYPVLDDIQFYLKTEGSAWYMQQLGDNYPFAQRPLYHRNFLLPVLLSSHNKTQIVLRVTTTSSMQVPIIYWPEREFYSQEQINLLSLGVLYGTIIIMILYNGLLGINTGDKGYFYYIIYISSILFFFITITGFSFQFFWPDNTALNNLGLIISLGLAIIGAVFFSETFLKINNYRFLKIAMNIIKTVVVLSIFSVYLLPYKIIIQTQLILSITALGIILSSGIYRWSKGFIPARYFTIAWSVHIIGGFAMSFSKFDLLPRSFFTENTLSMGTAFEALLLSFALMERLNEDKRIRLNLQNLAFELERKARVADQKALAQERLAREAQAETLRVEQQAIVNLEKKIQERTLELQMANEKLALQSITDGLTGLHNRRYFDGELEKTHALAQRQHTSYAVLLVDVDHFKHVNDNFGHQIGDEVLKELANILKSCIHRTTDICARYGGEEFVLVLPSTDAQGAMHIAEHIRHKAYEADLRHLHPELKLRVSIGVFAAIPTAENCAHDWVKHADEALYQAKANGRNQTVIYPAEATLSP